MKDIPRDILLICLAALALALALYVVVHGAHDIQVWRGKA